MPHDPGPSPSGSTPDHEHRDEERQHPRGDVAREAQQEVRSVAATAQDEAGRVADEVRHQTRELALDARDELRRQGEHQAEQLGHTVADIGVHLQALAEGRPEEAGRVQEVTSRIADQVQQLGHRMEERGLEGTLDELQRFARHRPGAFLAGAAAVGFAASRLTRAAAEDGQDGERRRSPTARSVVAEPPSTPEAGTADVGPSGPAPADQPRSLDDPRTTPMRTVPVPGRRTR